MKSRLVNAEASFLHREHTIPWHSLGQHLPFFARMQLQLAIAASSNLFYIAPVDIFNNSVMKTKAYPAILNSLGRTLIFKGITIGF